MITKLADQLEEQLAAREAATSDLEGERLDAEIDATVEALAELHPASADETLAMHRALTSLLRATPEGEDVFEYLPTRTMAARVLEAVPALIAA